jgi:hypothetical protein
MVRRPGVTVLVLGAVLVLPPLAPGQAPATAPPPPPHVVGLPLDGEAAEAFLRTARVLDRTPVGAGITRPDRMTLTDGIRTTRAIWKTIHDRRMGLQRLEGGGLEFDFRDSWRSEIAAYELDKALGLGLVPPTVERRIDGRAGSLQMWIEAAMTQDDRKRRGIEAPAAAAWNAQMHKVRLLHQLTYNTDHRNVRNVLIDPTFRVYAVDSSRAFRIQEDLLAPEDLVSFSRAVLEKLAALDRPLVEARLGSWLEKRQIDGLLARRDRILALVKERIAEKGEDAVLYP